MSSKVNVRVAAILALGIVLGIVSCLAFQRSEKTRSVFAQDQYMTFQDTVAADAAPKLSIGANNTARFSRPLEVPPLYAFDSALSDGTGRQIVLVDSTTKRICVYWIRERGVNSTIELVATRNFELDLQLTDFNCEGLSPSQIREQMESYGGQM